MSYTFTLDGLGVEITLMRVLYTPGKSSSEAPEYIEVHVKSLAVTNWQKAVILPFAKFNVSKLTQCCPFVSIGNTSKKKLDQELSSSLLDAIADGLLERGYYLSQNGAILFQDGIYRFVHGNELVGNPCDFTYKFAPHLQDVRLSGDNTLSLAELALLLLTAPPQVFLVLAYVLLTSVRSIILANGIDLQAVLYVTGKQAVLYVTGKQGLGKTTLVSRIAGIYQQVSDGKQMGLVQAGTTAAAINDLLISLRDQPLIVDDLCLSAGKAVARNRRELGATLIRQGAGQQPILKKRGKENVRFQCAAGVILTAEFTLENMSDLTRCLIVPLTDRLDLADELTPDVIGDTVRQYSEWFSLHGQEEVNELRHSLKRGNNTVLDPRVFTNYKCLGWALSVLKRCMEAQGLPQSTLDALTLRMNEAISLSIESHNRLRQSLLDKIPQGNIAWCILQGYEDKCFNLCKNIGKLAKHDGILWHNDLCLRASALVSFLRQQPGYQGISRNKITSYLKDKRALVIQEDEADTVHLEKSSKKRYIPRVYRIRLDVLKKIAEKF